jgi:hypothetical protein
VGHANVNDTLKSIWKTVPISSYCLRTGQQKLQGDVKTSDRITNLWIRFELEASRIQHTSPEY